MPDLRLSEEHAEAIARILAEGGHDELSAAFDAARAAAATPATCAHCGQPFDAGSGRAIYCSSRCKQAAYRARQKEWRRQWRPRR